MADFKKIGFISEKSLHQQVVDYLKYQYPSVYFRTDFAAGIKMTIGQALKHKKLQKCKAWPDIFIPKKSHGYAGLFIEIKKDISEVFLKDGITLKRDEHIKEQYMILRQLQAEGYKAVFGCGFDHCRGIIDEYLKNTLNGQNNYK
jgi:hypothetical protein